MFGATIAIVLVGVVLFLAYPFWRKEVSPIPVSYGTSQEQERTDLEMDKQRILSSLLELENEHFQGRLSLMDYQRLKTTDEHRLLKVLARLDALTGPSQMAESSSKPKSKLHSPPQPAVTQWIGPVVLGLLVVGSAVGLYSFVNGRIGIEAQRAAAQQQVESASGSQGMPNPVEMVARLEARLQQNPDDFQGQIMAGRSYMAMERFDDARKAWSKVIELDNRNHEAHYNLGLILLQTNTTDPKVFEEALTHFNAALMNVPREPAVLWYKGVALVHLKRYPEADESWTAAYQNLSPGSEDAEYVKQALQNLRAGKPPLFR
jgi:cytochrome c-type biogenesis protein CcmH